MTPRRIRLRGRPGGLGDVVGSEGFQHADGGVAKGAHARGAVPAWTVEVSSAKVTIPDVVRGVLPSPVPADRGGQVGRAGLVGVEAGDGVDTLTGLAPAVPGGGVLDDDVPPRQGREPAVAVGWLVGWS